MKPTTVEYWQNLAIANRKVAEDQFARIEQLERELAEARDTERLDKANVDLAVESARLRGLLSELVGAVDGMENLDEMDGEEFQTNSARLDAALEAARPHTEAALIAAPDAARMPVEIRLNPDGTLDEVCAPGVHLEQMSATSWFLSVGEVNLWLNSTGKITVTYEDNRSQKEG